MQYRFINRTEHKTKEKLSKNIKLFFAKRIIYGEIRINKTKRVKNPSIPSKKRTHTIAFINFTSLSLSINKYKNPILKNKIKKFYFLFIILKQNSIDLDYLINFKILYNRSDTIFFTLVVHIFIIEQMQKKYNIIFLIEIINDNIYKVIITHQHNRKTTRNSMNCIEICGME